MLYLKIFIQDLNLMMSKISRLEQITSWKRVLNAARRTIGKEPLDKEPSNSWKAKMLLAEHSPIRLLEYDWSWDTIKQWVTAHLVRHHEGCEKFVHSQRGDRRAILEEYNVNSRERSIYVHRKNFINHRWYRFFRKRSIKSFPQNRYWRDSYFLP